MPLNCDVSTIEAKLNAVLTDTVSANAIATTDGTKTAVVVGGVIPVTERFVIQHIESNDNPHNVTFTQVGAIPQRLSIFQDFNGNQDNSYLYVDENGTECSRISLSQIKRLGTQLVTATNIDDVDFSQLKENDYIYAEY